LGGDGKESPGEARGDITSGLTGGPSPGMQGLLMEDLGRELHTGAVLFLGGAPATAELWGQAVPGELLCKTGEAEGSEMGIWPGLGLGAEELHPGAGVGLAGLGLQPLAELGEAFLAAGTRAEESAELGPSEGWIKAAVQGELLKKEELQPETILWQPRTALCLGEKTEGLCPTLILHQEVAEGVDERQGLEVYNEGLEGLNDIPLSKSGGELSAALEKL
jgi:hypothetical protein